MPLQIPTHRLWTIDGKGQVKCDIAAVRTAADAAPCTRHDCTIAHRLAVIGRQEVTKDILALSYFVWGLLIKLIMMGIQPIN